MSSSSPPRRERGAALLIALSVVAVVTLLAARLGYDYLTAFHGVEARLSQAQIRQQLLAGEALARRLLLAPPGARDSLEQPWAQPFSLPLGEPGQGVGDRAGRLQGHLLDLQGRFNLNALIGTAEEVDEAMEAATGTAPDEALRPRHDDDLPDAGSELQRFIRLLQALPPGVALDRPRAEALATGLRDWLVHGDAQRPPLQPLRAVSELRSAPGVDARLYRALEPLLSAWPVSPEPLNVNTAPAALLAAINRYGAPQPLTGPALDRLLALQRAGVDAVDQLEQEGVSGLRLDVSGLGTRSDWFLLEVEWRAPGRPPQRLHSVLRRSEQDVRVVARRFGVAWEAGT